MKAITFQLKARQPILVTSFQGDPNSDVSFGYIPGSSLRGAFIARYLKQRPVEDNILEDATIQRLFFNGTTCYLNAYLHCPLRPYRTLPTPRCWQGKKGQESPAEIYDLSQAIPSADIKTKSLSQGFCHMRGETVMLYREQRRINIHNLRDRRKGRATKDSGEVFRYEALDSGQVFQAVILCHQDADAALIQPLLQDDLWIGGSQSAGYGQMQIQSVQVLDNWNEVGSDLETRLRNRTFLKLTLLSDLILRDQSGQSLTYPPTELLSDYLRVQLTLKDCHLSRIHIGGFNRKWGLPLPQVSAIAAGSVLIYSMPTESLAGENLAGENLTESFTAALARLEATGLGERRVEGFGRIAVNGFAESATLTVDQDQRTQRLTAVEVTSDSGQQLAQEMAQRLLRRKLEARLLEQLDIYTIEGNLTNSQLSRLMSATRHALSQANHQVTQTNSTAPSSNRFSLVTELLENLPGSAKKRWESAKLGDRSLPEQLKHWGSHPNDWIAATNSPALSVTLAGTTQTLTSALAEEYTLRLIMAIVKKAMKKESNPDDR